MNLSFTVTSVVTVKISCLVGETDSKTFYSECSKRGHDVVL